MMLAGCGTKKKVSPIIPQESVPTWHTCLIRNAQATIEMDQGSRTGSMKVSAKVTMQAVRDSLVVISIIPMLGIEMMRIEATPTQVTCIDKLHGQYAVASYNLLNQYITPKLTWETIQQICAAELPNGEKNAKLRYSIKKQTIDLYIQYPERVLDSPIRIQKQPIHKYEKIDITQWL
jgi:hypothetical protein